MMQIFNVNQYVCIGITILCCQILLSKANEFNTELVHVQVIFRHGDRTPIRKNFYDTYKPNFWSKFGGFGQLTQQGMRHCFEFGKFLKNYYAGFIGGFYEREKIFIRSTDYDRTLMSAQGILAGLFIPEGYQVWNEDINWQPVPVHTSNIEFDKIFNINPCPLYNQLKDNVFRSKEFLDLSIKNENIVKQINDGIGGANLTLAEFESLADSLYIQKENNLTLPSWISKPVDIYERTLELGRELYYYYFYDVKMARLISGGILNQIRQNIADKLSNDSSGAQQLYLFSGHDNFLAALIKLFDVDIHLTQPNYLAAIVLELRKNAENKYFVRVLFKNNKSNEPPTLNEVNILNCTENHLCPIEAFMTKTKALVVTDFAFECKLSPIRGSNLTFYILFLGCLTVAVIMTLFAIINLRLYVRAYAKKRFNQSERINLIINEDENYDENSSRD